MDSRLELWQPALVNGKLRCYIHQWYALWYQKAPNAEQAWLSL